MIFQNRQEAGQLLAKAIKALPSGNAVVFGIARGGLPVADEVAKSLKCPLEVLLVRKIGHPYDSEYAIGAVAETDEPLFNQDEISNIDQKWLTSIIANERQTINKRAELYRQGKPIISAKDKIAIIIDDGIATGLTMRSAVQFITTQKPKYKIVAVPVSAPDASSVVERDVDKFVTLTDMSGLFSSVGSYYKNFPQLTDDQVIEYL